MFPELLSLVIDLMAREREASKETAKAIRALCVAARSVDRYEELPIEIRKRFERMSSKRYV
jgi:hypothetical protein